MIDRENEFFGDIKSENTEEINTSSTGINYGDRNDKAGMKNIIIAVVAGAVFAAMLLLLLSPRRDSRDTTNFAEIPTLSQPTGPIRIEPTDQMPMPSEVFESATIYNAPADPSTIYQPAPLPAAPVIKSVEPAPVPTKSENKLPKKAPVKPAPKAEVKKAPAPVKPVQKIVTKPTPKSNKNLPERELVEKTTGVPGEVEMALVDPKAGNTKGLWNVQLVSTSTESAAHNEWENLSKKYPAILGNRSHTVSKTEVNGKTYYRLRVSNIETSEQATEICNQLKTYQLSCFVVK